jgi:peptidoglycan/xylan/chitin deacetylase (PgdA/CDA1 family)
MRAALACGFVAAAAVLASGCGSSGHAAPASPGKPPAHKTPARFDPKAVGANELGQIPVIMYHRIVPHPTSVYDTSPSQFRKQLEKLYRQGYRPIRASDLVTGHIDVPAGMTPVVLTFDDSSSQQFSLLPDGKIDPKSGIGILEDFARTHPGFHATGTLFVIGSSLFGGVANGPQMLANLYELGFEIADHTYDHLDLATLDATSVQKEIVLCERVIAKAVPAQQVQTMALPYGAYPNPHKLALEGSWDGQSYKFRGVFEVGAGPAPSPFGINFDPLAIPRMRAGPYRHQVDYVSGYWLHYLKLHPDQRFISDGDPNRISFPSVLAGAVAKQYRREANPY